MNKLAYQIQQITKRNRDGSYATQSNRRDILVACANQLKELGYYPNKMTPHDLKGRHIKKLVASWQSEGKSTATIKNRMAHLRWLAEKIDNKGLVLENDYYNIERRQFTTNEDKSITLERADMAKLSPEVTYSVQLQQAFGLRREESMKFSLSYALDNQKVNHAEYIRLKPSWTKGGRYREIPITSSQQRELLIDIALNHGNGSLIPNHRTYKEHLSRFEKETAGADIGNTHGLRHNYAQQRYIELTDGLQPPCKLDELPKLTAEQKELDRNAREVVSAELGHGRIDVTNNYLGSYYFS